MVFTSSVFLFLFLPLFLGIYFLLPVRWRTTWMLLASYLFYGWWRVDFLALFAATSVFTHLVGGRVARNRADAPARARRWLTFGVVGNLATLAYFKYFNFGAESLNALLGALGASTFSHWDVILPIGISFYVFQSVSYLVDVHRGDVEAGERFVDVAAYIALFPQLIAGPIVRYKVLGPQLAAPTASFTDFGMGARRFMVGFCKKVLIADMVAPLADAVFAAPTVGTAEAWLGVLAYAIQLFFDFSGYSDMAIGLARMMGLRLLENFDRPYISATITEFWRRWHISLSRWLRDYLYIPLGGNRRGRQRTYVNLLTVMVLGGLWHGASWNFVLWGAWHGLLLVSERLLTESGFALRLPRFIAVLRTFVFVLIGWVTFRAVDVLSALAMYEAMFTLQGEGVSAQLLWQVPVTAFVGLVAGCVIAWFPLPAKRDEAPARAPARFDLAGLALLPVFLLGVLRTVADSFSPFLYFQF